MVRFITLALLLSINVGFSQSTRLEEFEKLHKEALKCLKRDVDSSYTIAIKASVLATGKQHYKINYLLGYISNMRKWFSKSIAYYKKAAEFANKHQLNDLQSNIADNFFELGKYDEALSSAKEAVRYSKKTKDKYIYYTYGILAKVFAEQKRLDSARYYFDKAIRMIPKKQEGNGVKSGFLVSKADMYKKNNLIDSAIVLYKKSLNYDHPPYKRCETLVNIGETFLEKKEVVQAQAYLNAAKALGVNHLFCSIRILSLEASIYHSEGKFGVAEELFVRLDSILKVNRSILMEEDLKLFLSIKDSVQKNILDMYNKTEIKAEVRGWLLVVLSVIGGLLALTLLFKKPSFPPENVNGIDKRLRVTYRNSQSKEDVDALKKMKEALEKWRSNRSSSIGLD